MDELDLIRGFRVPDSSSDPGARAVSRARLDAAIAGEAEGGVARRPALRRLGAASVVVLVAAAGTIYAARDRDSATPGMAYVDAQVRYPYETADDVVTYSDHVVLVTAVSEIELPNDAPPERAAAGEGEVYRRVTFRVERSLWSRAGAPAAPAEFTSVWWGWLVENHARRPVTAHGAPWVRVGSRYVLPLAFENGRFEPIQLFAAFPMGETVEPAEGQDTALARRLAGKTPADVSAVFAAAKARPRR